MNDNLLILECSVQNLVSNISLESPVGLGVVVGVYEEFLRKKSVFPIPGSFPGVPNTLAIFANHEDLPFVSNPHKVLLWIYI